MFENATFWRMDVKIEEYSSKGIKSERSICL
jgi:hypothetical protein